MKYSFEKVGQSLACRSTSAKQKVIKGKILQK